MNNKFDYIINDISTIDDGLSLSIEIFKPSEEDKEKYHNRADWVSKIQNDGLIISVYENIHCIAFAICYKKSEEILHIWNVGVSKEYRRMGVWKDMYDIIIEYAKDNGYKEVSINTYKEKFPSMYSFIHNEGFLLIKEEEKSNGFIKSSFRKVI